MNWLQCLSKAIDYIETHLSDEINLEQIARQSYTSVSHFQLIFHLVTGITVGEYIRNRRLSAAALDLLNTNNKVIDVAVQYRYDTSESFSKAFTRFFGFPPSKIQREKLRLYRPLTISVMIEGGFDMSRRFTGEFHWNDVKDANTAISDAERYNMVVKWARKARGQNPNVFDALTEWILDDNEWSEEKLTENQQILMQGVLGRFKEQNAKLRSYLKELEPSGVVNEAVFKALDSFDDELSGKPADKRLGAVVASVFADFAVMRERSVREQFAGNKTGAHGTDSVEIFGYVNRLKDCDAGVQWALFMPDVVKKQQKGFVMDSFEYKKLPAMRFIGKECIEHDSADMSFELEIMQALVKMSEYKTELDFDVLFQHHYGLGVDKERWHGFWGRFMKADTPVPEGFVSFDFIPERDVNNFCIGAPYLSQFAYAVFSGDMEAMHNDEGTDGGRMYDVTRNKILGENVNIPYPDKYWTAEVFLGGCDKWSTAYMFSAELQ